MESERNVFSTLRRLPRKKRGMGKKSKKGKVSNKGRGGGSAAAKKRNTKSGSGIKQAASNAATKDSVSTQAAVAEVTVADTFNKENAFIPKEEDKGVLLNAEDTKPSPDEGVEEKANNTEAAAAITIEAAEQKSEVEAPIPSPAVVSIVNEPETIEGDVDDEITKNVDLSMMVDALVNEDEPTVEPPIVEPTVEPIAEPAMSTPKKVNPAAEERGDSGEIWDNRIKDVLDKDKPVYDVTPVKPRSVPMLDTPDAKDLESKQECGCFIQ